MQLGDLLDQRSPLGHCRATRPFAVRLSRRGKRLLHLFVGRGRVLLHYVPGRGVDHCVQTHVTPLISEIRCVHCNGIAATLFPVLVVWDAIAPLATEVRADDVSRNTWREPPGGASIPTDEEARAAPDPISRSPMVGRFWAPAGTDGPRVMPETRCVSKIGSGGQGRPGI